MAGAKTLALVRSADGLVFTILFKPLDPGEGTHPRRYESYEAGMLSSGRIQKIASKHISFKGVPAYQIDVQTPKGQSGSLRIAYANNRFYHLQLVNSLGAFRTDANLAPIFEGFEFIGQPEPVRISADDEAFLRGFERGREAGPFLGVCCGLVFVGGIVGLVIYLIRRNRPYDHRPDEPDEYR